jgi:hypothetical protein
MALLIVHPLTEWLDLVRTQHSLDRIQLCDATAHCLQMLTDVRVNTLFLRAREAQTVQFTARRIGKLCEASTVVGDDEGIIPFRVRTVSERVDGGEDLTKTVLTSVVRRPHEQFRAELVFDDFDDFGFLHAGERAITSAGVRFDLFDETIDGFLACDALFSELH